MTDRILIIAEAGVNHNGDIELAKQLIDAAAESGADIVKFQTFNANRLVTRTAKKADTRIRLRIVKNPSMICFVVWNFLPRCIMNSSRTVRRAK
jgi:sialic acid synthase SpsE